MAADDAVFLDTSIQIARFVHSPKIKRRIENRISRYRISVTSLVVRQEFKRRLLKEANYLLRQLKRLGSVEEVQRHVHDALPKQQDRKRRISLQILMTVFEQDDSHDRTERAALFLRYLLRGGLDEFDELAGHVVEASRCACGMADAREKKSGEFDFGTDKCSQTGGRCGVRDFLTKNEPQMKNLATLFKGTPDQDKSEEVKRAEVFLEEAIGSLEHIEQREPCLRVGDLLIALESLGVPAFFTMNGKESQHFCRAFNQDLVVRRPNPDHDDIVCMRNVHPWPKF